MTLFRNWTFAWWEVSILKVGLISFGILLGVYFFDYLRDVMWLWWMLFAVSGAYFIGRMAREGGEPPSQARQENHDQHQ